MKRIALASFLLGACSPNLENGAPPPPVIEVQFDPGASPPVVPTPNDLTPRNPSSGKLMIPHSMSDSLAQTEFNDSYLGNLEAFPYESTAHVLVSGPLDPGTVTAQNIVVIDLTSAMQMPSSPASAVVAGLHVAFDATSSAISITAPGGWTRAHHYAVALLAHTDSHPTGLLGVSGQLVVGSPAWALVSGSNPLVICPAAPNGAQDFTSPACRPAVDVIPSTLSDPAARRLQQTSSAIALEQLRLQLRPLLETVEAALGLPDASALPMVWSFTIADAGEVTFDPASGVIPFPNDALRSNGKVALPNPKTGYPPSVADCAAPVDTATQLYCGLNTLDGFSTIAPLVSENSLVKGAVQQANVDPATLTPQSVGLVALGTQAASGEVTAPSFTPCLNCASSLGPNGQPQTAPQQLQWRLDVPLDEKSTYLAYVTSDMKDDQHKSVIATPTFALLRLSNPLIMQGRSQVSVLSDAQAAQLEPLRLALKPAIDRLVSNGVTRSNIALAWVFTTQSEATALDALYGYAAGQRYKQALPRLPPGLILLADETARYTAEASLLTIPIDQIGTFYAGAFVTPYALTGPGGTLDPTAPKAQPVMFTMSVPNARKVPPPAAGYPVTIFGHGFTRSRDDFLPLANALAKAGQVAVATDAPLHGDRSSCTDAGAFLTTVARRSDPSAAAVVDDAACLDPVTMRCNEDPLVGLCVARDDTQRAACPGLNVTGAPDPTGNGGCLMMRQGLCASDGKCQGAVGSQPAGLKLDGNRPAISGWNIFSLTNFFATRDHLRQEVIDLAQLVRALRLTGPLSLANQIAAVIMAGPSQNPAPPIDVTKLNYVGQGLGGIMGTLFNAVSPDTTYVVLNTPGGDLPALILQAPSFATDKALFQGGLAAQGILPGTASYDEYLGIVQWILDAADPANMAWRLTHPVTVPDLGVLSPNPNRKAFIQFIEADQTVPNVSSTGLLTAAARPTTPLTFMPPSFACASPLFCYEFTDAVDGFDMTSAPPVGRHAFLLAPPVASPSAVPSDASKLLTATAQTQVATFLATGNFQ